MQSILLILVMGINGLTSYDLGNGTGRTLDDYDFKNGVPNRAYLVELY